MNSSSVFPAEIIMTKAAAELHVAETILAPGQKAPLDLSVFVSCYNESSLITHTLDNLRAALAELGHIRYEIIVIDDCSHDDSADLVADYIRAHPDERIILRRNKVNRGLAQNYFDAAFIGKGKYFRLICGDDAEPKDTMVAVFGAIGETDMVIPYYVSSEGRSGYRMLISNTFTTLVNAISGFHLHYYNGLAVHLRYNVMRWHPNTRGFGFQADILCMLLDQGFTYKEVPVRTVERKGSGSRALRSRTCCQLLTRLSILPFGGFQDGFTNLRRSQKPGL